MRQILYIITDYCRDEIPDDIALIIITMERMESAKGLPALSMACRWESYQELAVSLIALKRL